ISRFPGELDTLREQAPCLVLEPLRPDPPHMLEAMEEIQVSPTIQLKRVGPENLGTGGQVVRVHLPERFRVLLDSVAAPVNAPPANLRPHTPVPPSHPPTAT